MALWLFYNHAVYNDNTNLKKLSAFLICQALFLALLSPFFLILHFLFPHEIA